ncbi:MAG: MoaD/ThiS family protein [Anaerolineales bacterium]|nr:MoaD/ThiS family protein [Anaerolineales bacterium]
MPTVNVTLYGDIAQYAGGNHIATLNLDLPEGAVVEDLLKKISLPPEERGYLFINAVLFDAPGLYASQDETLHDQDHIGIFSTRHMWPYQYRDGIHLSNSLKDALREKGPIHNTYRSFNL